MSASRLEGQVIAVTAAESGFGRSIATALSTQGATVVLIGGNAEAASQLASRIEAQGGSAIPIKSEGTGLLDWTGAQEKILEIFGSLHGVVHVADKVSHSNFDYLPASEWNDLTSWNVRSTLLILQSLERALPETWTTLIGPPLSADKLHMHALRGALEQLTTHALQERLRVNLLLPSRSAGSEEHDRGLCELVIALADPHLAHIGGNVIPVPLPDLPSLEMEFQGNLGEDWE
ncbi:NAD(P)-dependent dehydrogenase (short-subunit alcohol dehydrogenase family) [Deinobacterium chartae]|uniref:NAD(P)-dependent dehydrogenase (Short-subunit alcohol dehydrogenase family) n=1 Tax=Deinobacterium chartae TaxID=521158 RepID=A0A841I7C1_9DEIO|nr:NAD(P)-dependent dehydrogenase (short-subunit alcohol dehydrogenase family) [Deinobacterium chartae]